MERAPVPELASVDDLRRRSAELEAQLREALETIEAIRSGDVDAVVIGGDGGQPQIYTLQDADRPYRLLIEQMQEGALTLSHDGVVLYCNRAFATMLGATPENVVGQPVAPLVKNSGKFLELLRRRGRGEAVFASEHGGTIPVKVSFAEMPSEEGFEGLVCAVVTDLSEERRQAALLGEAQSRLAANVARREGEGFSRLIIDSAMDFAIIATDLDARVTTWNEGARKIFGWDASETLGAPVPFIWTEEDRLSGAPEAEMAAASVTGRAEDERWHLRRDGSRFWANGLMMPLVGGDGDQIGFLKILRDRTESRAAEAALRESESRLRFTLKAGRLGAWELDIATGELVSSETCRANFGRSLDEPFAYDDLKQAVFAEDRDRMEAAVQRSLSERVDYDIEYRVVWPSGEVRWVQIRGRPVYSELGAPIRMTGVSLDITDRRRAAEDLERLNRTLETRVEDEVAQRGKAEDALRQSQKMEAVGQLTGGVAHDFNNLLTIVRSSVDFLRRSDLPDERRKRYVDAISDTVDRAAKLTGQLLAFARRQTLKPEIFDVGRQVGATADMLRTIVGARVTIEIEILDDAPAYVEADVSQFQTALVNLVVNARDAMNGEGLLRMKIATDRDGTKTAAAPSFVAISVTDTGTGIGSDKIGHIFEPFYTTKEVGKGTGLGLSQTYGFAKQSGGDVAVSSVLGQGSTFTILLPRVEPSGTAGMPPEELVSGESRGGDGQWILVVEDNADVGVFSTQMLQDLGYNTVWARNGQEALDLLAASPDKFDLVFSDVVMPGMGGVALGRSIRTRYPNLPVVLTSGYSDALVEGRHGFELLQKPYATEDLSRLIRLTLRAR